MSDEGATVLASAVEWTDEIDLERAERAKKKAEDILSDKSRADEFGRAEIKLKRALARLSVGQRQR